MEPSGISISDLHKGTWNSATAYIPGNIVIHDGSSYICVQNHTNQEPPSNEAYWRLFAMKGTDGQDGEDGEDGTDGTGDVNGPASATSNAIVVFDGATGKLLKNCTILIVGDDVRLPTGGNIQVNGADPKRGIYIPAQGLFAAITNGAPQGQIETSSNKINTIVRDFDASTEEYAWVALPAPSYWDLSTIQLIFHWTAASGSGDVIWGSAALARSDDDALDAALGTAEEVTDTLLTANDHHKSPTTDALTVGGTPAKDDYIYIRIYRKAADGGDTLGVDARLIGVTVKFGVGQYDDQ